MGKEIIIKTVGRGLALTKDFVTKPYVAQSSLGTGVISSFLGLGIAGGSTEDIVTFGVATVVNASATLIFALDSRSNPPKIPH